MSSNQIIKSITNENHHDIIELSGEIDMVHSVELRSVLLETLETDTQAILLEMSKVSFIDSSGLATLVEGLQIGRKKNILFKLCGLQARVSNAFEVSKLDTLFSIYSTKQEALEQ